jgi:hypothetical protein
MNTVPDAGFTYAPGDQAAFARALQRYLDDPALLARSRRTSLDAARRL